MKKVLLYSGGMDSWLINHFWRPDVLLYVDVGGRYSDFEKKNLPSEVIVFPLPIGCFEYEDLFLPLRNLYFLMVASNFGDTLCLGATRGDWNQLDKSPEFIDRAEDILNFLWRKQSKFDGRSIVVEREFMNKSKVDLTRKFVVEGGDIESLRAFSKSCYSPVLGVECLNCKPCFRKFVALSANGYEYTEEERKKMWTYVRREIVPRKKIEETHQTYYKDRPGEGKAAISVVKSLYEEFGGNIENDERS